jgi:hypothetical protein
MGSASQLSWYSYYDLSISIHRRGWKWEVNSSSGRLLMYGLEDNRAGARYHCYKALLLLLAASAPERKFK